MSIIQNLLNKRICWKIGHDWKYESPTLGGDWIRCARCRGLEEYLPGLHEPKGYAPDARSSEADSTNTSPEGESKS